MKLASALLTSLILFFAPKHILAQTLEEVLSYGLPVVVVNTVNEEEPTAELISTPPEGCIGYGITNVTKVPGRVRIFLPGDTENPAYDSGEYVKGESGMTIKIRGNSSALATAKRPYKIKLQKKADMLLRGCSDKYKDKDWALLKAQPTKAAKFSCPIFSKIGNVVTEVLKVTEWVPDSRYVNLLFNGNFRGYYQLTETIKRNEMCRINVDKHTGYISEIDPYYWNEDVYVESSFLTDTSSPFQFTFKYPDSDDIIEEQLADFKAFIDLFDASIVSGCYPQLIDVESCARWLLAHQILGTLDGAGSNVYIIRRNDHSMLTMGPLWDFDSIFRVQGRWTNIISLHYFKYMLQKSPNKLLAREMIRIWNTEKEHVLAEVQHYHDSLVGTDYAEAIDKSTEANAKKWGSKQMDKIDVSAENLAAWLSTRAHEIDSLLNTLNTVDGDFSYDPLLDCIMSPRAHGLSRARKVVRDGHLYIIKDNETYSIDGKRIKQGLCLREEHQSFQDSLRGLIERTSMSSP